MEREYLRRRPALGAAPPAVHAGPHGSDDLPERLFIRGHSEGLLSATRHRAHLRKHSRRPGHFFPRDARKAEAIYRHRFERSGSEGIVRKHWRWRREYRAYAARTKADRRTKSKRGPGDRAAAEEAGRGAGRDLILARQSGPHGWWPAK